MTKHATQTGKTNTERAVSAGMATESKSPQKEERKRQYRVLQDGASWDGHACAKGDVLTMTEAEAANCRARDFRLEDVDPDEDKKGAGGPDG